MFCFPVLWFVGLTSEPYVSSVLECMLALQKTVFTLEFILVLHLEAASK